MSNSQNIPGLPPAQTLSGTEQFWAVQQNQDVRVTAAQIATFAGGGGGGSIGQMVSRVVTDPASAVFGLLDVALLINLQTPAPLTITLPTPVNPNTVGYSRVILIKDMARNAQTNNITLDAGAGKLIESQQTLVMNANGEITVLFSMSGTQWGIWT